MLNTRVERITIARQGKLGLLHKDLSCLAIVYICQNKSKQGMALTLRVLNTSKSRAI